MLSEKNFMYLILITVLSIVVSCKQKSTKQKFIETPNKSVTESIPTFLIYGELMPDGYIKQKDSSITQKFGFNIKRVAGCEITNKLVDSVKTINQKNNEIMRSQYGNNWKQKFETATRQKIAIPEIN